MNYEALWLNISLMLTTIFSGKYSTEIDPVVLVIAAIFVAYWVIILVVLPLRRWRKNRKYKNTGGF